MMARRLAALAAAFLLLSACGGGGASEESAEESGVSTVEGDADAPADAEGDVAFGGEGGAENAEEAANPAPPVSEELPEPPPVRTGDRVIKEGTISIEVEQDQFDRAFLAVITKARQYGGDAVGSSTRTADNGDTFGSVTVRVPVENFEDLVVGVGDIGKIRNRDIDSQDVSAEFTDLESRLRHLQAQERFYLELYERADTVQDAISVQQQLDGIQSQIEKVQGRRNLLDDRTTFSTLTVELFEPQAGGELLADEEAPNDRPSLARYWNTARDAFVNVVGAMLVALLFLLPLLVPTAVLIALWMSYRRSRRPVVAPPMEDVEEQQPVGAGR